MSKVSKHEEKMINLQTQMRQNQSELQNYLADLDNWESDIKKKEEKLKSGDAGGKGSNLPPVRNTIHKKKLKKKKKEKEVPSDKPRTGKISGFDFRAWDQFDVEKALEEVDKDEGKKETSSSEYETDEEWELERKKHLAGQEKDKGNDFLKRGDIDKAVEAYSKGMDFDPTNAILPANRAMALLKQQKFAAAELDCTTSISLDPMYVKAYLRRATARSSLGKLDEAVADFNRVLDLEPSNKQAKTEIERLQKELKREDEAPVTTTLTEDECGRVKPIYKPPEERSKKPLFRVPIEEIGIETAARPAPSADQSELAKKISAKEKEDFEKLFVSSASSPAGTKIEELTTTKPALVNERRDMAPEDRASDTKKEIPGHDKIKQVTTPVKAQASQPESRLEEQSRSTSRDTKHKSGSESSSATVSGPKVSAASSLAVSSSSERTSSADTEGAEDKLSPPQTSFQFQADFKQLKRKPESFFQYFQAIPPDNYPKLFGQSIDADILTTILKTLALHPEKVDLYSVLHSLTLVKRFSMTAMFLSRKEKQVVSDLIDSISKTGQRPDSELNSLRKAYDL
ncbi:RNA polymerase II-associated protein 3 [Aplysia californica]|uniref:RNA polymerase II-associated protein 3 n=1 Tax=Aplysia californica TaxID=6500 RepID=A0ABM0K4M9_APLCA|nr:RNA polymerase II-associated protein 3 [Aplysia californica]